MQPRPHSGIQRWLIPGATLAAIAAALAFTLTPRRDDALPRDCSLTPNAYHPGVFQGWKITLPRGGDGGGELFALVDLDDGRRVVAHNVTNPDVKRGDRIVVAEIACVHRAVHLLTEFPAPPAATDRR